MCGGILVRPTQKSCKTKGLVPRASKTARWRGRRHRICRSANAARGDPRHYRLSPVVCSNKSVIVRQRGLIYQNGGNISISTTTLRAIPAAMMRRWFFSFCRGRVKFDPDDKKRSLEHRSAACEDPSVWRFISNFQIPCISSEYCRSSWSLYLDRLHSDAFTCIGSVRLRMDLGTSSSCGIARGRV